MISQHWFRWWLGAVRQQAITWAANVDPDLYHHMALLGCAMFCYDSCCFKYVLTFTWYFMGRFCAFDYYKYFGLALLQVYPFGSVMYLFPAMLCEVIFSQKLKEFCHPRESSQCDDLPISMFNKPDWYSEKLLFSLTYVQMNDFNMSQFSSVKQELFLKLIVI